MPFGMTALEQYAWFHQGGGLELANKVFGKHGIEVMTGGNTTMQMGGWFRKEIASVEDLKGLKMRIPGFGGKVLAGIGAVPTNIPAGELYQALERGTIDALEWVGPSLDLRMGFHKVAPFYYTGWHEPSTELMYFFNKNKMDSLPAWAKSILLNAAKLTGFNMTVQSQHDSAVNWATMKQEFPNIVVKNFPSDVIDALRASNQTLLEEERSKSEVAAEIIDSQAAYLSTVRRWTEIGDWSYLANITQ
jgi:TRAP-type mannitol/chloroaromatic compound transport system substrate-binding protein